MKKITLFIMATCPYCKRALALMDELTEENVEFKQIEIEIIDERKHPNVADKFDYFLVPTFYVGSEKVHEGAASKEIIKSVYKKAL